MGTNVTLRPRAPSAPCVARGDRRCRGDRQCQRAGDARAVRRSGRTLSPAVYSRALAPHALTLLGMFIAAFVAIPTLVIRPGRGAIVLGGLGVHIGMRDRDAAVIR